ncbi:MAG: hypothetical protein U0183_03645 [Polyangiaceae bacterium]|jgi:hypothetical protein
MGPKALLRTLVTLARKVGVEVREVELSPLQRTRGGECRVHGKTVVLLDVTSPTFDRACLVAAALAKRDLSGIALPAELRDLIDRGPRAPRIIPAEQLRPLAKARPRPRAERASV